MPDNDPTNKAAGFNGADAGASGAYLQRADNASLSLGSNTLFTIGCWVYLNAATAGRVFGFIQKANTTSGYFLQKLNDGSNRVQFGTVVGGVFTRATAITFGALSAATWYFIVGWYDGTNINVQINNGAIDSVANPNMTADDSAIFQIGSDIGFANQTHDGRIDSPFMCKSVLSAAVKTSLYNAGVGKRHCQLEPAEAALFDGATGGGYWNLGEAGGATRVDSSNNGNNLTEGDADTVTQEVGVTTGPCLDEPNNPRLRTMMMFD